MRHARPVGTAELLRWISTVPMGRASRVVARAPSDESLGYCRRSLRDRMCVPPSVAHSWPLDAGGEGTVTSRVSMLRSARLFDLHPLFDVPGNVFGNFIIFCAVNALGFEIDLDVLQELLEVRVLLAELVNGFPVK